MKRVELLAPAGDLKKLEYAFAYGADAVYCGIPDFSLRVRINEFDLQDLKKGIAYAHNLKKKVYVTLNIFAHERHLTKIKKHILILKKLKPDALIVSDPGIISIIKRVWPKAEIHLSTQANCTNSEAVKFWSEQGVKRIILAREVTLAEIKAIHQKAPKVELEYFVHGAMCMSYSGRCLLSKFFTDRSGNLGDCTQPCRWRYNIKALKQESNPSTPKLRRTDEAIKQKNTKIIIEEESRPGTLLDLEEDIHGTYIMNSKDLCLIEYLGELRKAGITSFKIEGRAKSIYYVGNTVRAYRQAIERKNSKIEIQKLGNELKKAQYRGFTTGFLFGREKCEQLDCKSHEDCDWEFCGEITEYKYNANLRMHLGKVNVHNQIFVGDKLEFVVPRGNNVEYKVKKMYNKDREEINEAHGGQGNYIYLPVDYDLSEMTLVRRKI